MLVCTCYLEIVFWLRAIKPSSSDLSISDHVNMVYTGPVMSEVIN